MRWWKIVFVVIVLLCSSSNFKALSQSKIYVSALGDDANDGLSIQTAVRTVKAGIAKGDTILLHSGEVFYEGSLRLSNKTLSRFGEGENPVVCGYRRIVEPKWEKVGPNIWRLNLVEDNFSGIILEGSSKSNNICAFHDYERDLIHGRKVWHRQEMQNDWDFWQTEELNNAEAEEFDFLYLYLSSDPNKMRLEISVYDAALQADHSVIDGIDFVGFGFGISARTHTIIRNCRIDAIGGRIIPDGKSYVCYGNGIEFYVEGTNNVENCLVEKCLISRCYDCGVTIQGSGGTTATPKNIIIRNNVITDCCQGWEDFLRNNPDVVFENCVFEMNLVLNSGLTSGFGYADGRVKYCHVLGNNVKGNKGMIIRNNTFVGGNYYCSGAYQGKYKSNVWEGNTCVIGRGDYILSNYTGTRDVIRIPTKKGSFCSLNAATSDAIRQYRKLTGDKTTKFVIVSKRHIDRRINELKKKSISK